MCASWPPARSSCSRRCAAWMRDQGHAAVTSVAIHREGTKIDPATGDHIVFTRSGSCCYVLVADLEDGSRHAIGVGYPGISTEPIAAEWEVADGRPAP